MEAFVESSKLIGRDVDPYRNDAVETVPWSPLGKIGIVLDGNKVGKHSAGGP